MINSLHHIHEKILICFGLQSCSFHKCPLTTENNSCETKVYLRIQKHNRVSPTSSFTLTTRSWMCNLTFKCFSSFLNPFWSWKAAYDVADCHFIYLSWCWERILADDFASKNNSPTSCMSSLAITDRPFTFAVKADGVNSWTAYLKKKIPRSMSGTVLTRTHNKIHYFFTVKLSLPLPITYFIVVAISPNLS